MTLDQLAHEAYDQFEYAERPDGETFERLKDGAPEWVHELVREAHGEFLPDDWRYDAIKSALAHIYDTGPEDADDVDPHEFADQHVDVYTSARLAWLSSNLQRASYVDEAASEGLIDPDTDEVGRIGVGQYMEALEVMGSVLESLRERLEEIEDEEVETDA
jgi:hypothetical protein